MECKVVGLRLTGLLQYPHSGEVRILREGTHGEEKLRKLSSLPYCISQVDPQLDPRRLESALISIRVRRRRSGNCKTSLKPRIFVRQPPASRTLKCKSPQLFRKIECFVDIASSVSAISERGSKPCVYSRCPCVQRRHQRYLLSFFLGIRVVDAQFICPYCHSAMLITQVS